MSLPANLYPGLNDIYDVLEEFPIETSRYLTLLHEIDAKCVISSPRLNESIDKFVSQKDTQDKLSVLGEVNKYFEELMPSLEEKMHVSSIMLKSLQYLTERMELAYEIAIKNQEIPESLRLGADNHPAMHLHHELMQKITSQHSNSKSSQSLKSESRREAMAANRRQQQQQQQQEGPTTTAGRKRGQLTTTRPDGKRRKTKTNGPSSSSSSSNSSSADPSLLSSFLAPTLPAAHRKNNSGASKPKFNEYGEPLYCYCNQVAYGEMVGCDGSHCELEWFHLPCIGLETLPRGKWYCDDCKRKRN